MAEVGVELIEQAVTDLGELTTDQVVLAAGSNSAQLWPHLPVRPVKGEILRLRARPGVTPAPLRTIRGSVHGRPSYLVPRADGIVVAQRSTSRVTTPRSPSRVCATSSPTPRR